jgi:hypothetical protein
MISRNDLARGDLTSSFPQNYRLQAFEEDNNVEEVSEANKNL